MKITDHSDGHYKYVTRMQREGKSRLAEAAPTPPGFTKGKTEKRLHVNKEELVGQVSIPAVEGWAK